MNKSRVFILGLIAPFCMGIFSSCNGANASFENSSEGTSLEVEKLVDFTVEVEEGRDPIVLQLSDTQIIDSAQQRSPDRLGTTLTEYWATDKMEDRCFRYLRYTIEQSQPDLILLTGDIIYGEFDDSGYCLEQLINFMESFEIPWAPLMGNHEGESKKGIDWQCEQLEKAEHCLFKQRRLQGNGNYSVGLVQGGRLLRAFFMMDSNGYSNMSEETVGNKHSVSAAGFGENQIAWYTDAIELIKQYSPETKLSFAFHIPSQPFLNAFTEKYPYDEKEGNLIDLDEVGEDADFGLINGKMGGVWDKELSIWTGWKEMGVDSVFVGHVHAMSASVMYQGIRLQFGQKSSTYDAVNYIAEDGAIVHSYSEAGEPIVGGTVIPISWETGEIKPYILLYKE